jgi:hypothetical protein
MAMNSLRQRAKEPVARDRRFKRLSRYTLVAKPVEKQLVQDHGVRGDQLLALEAIDEKIRSRVEVETRELLGDEIEPLHSAAVVVLVVADDQLFRHALDALRIAPKGLHCVHHSVPPLRQRLDFQAIKARDTVRRGAERDSACRAERCIGCGENWLPIKGDREPIAFGFQRKRVPLSRSHVGWRARKLVPRAMDDAIEPKISRQGARANHVVVIGRRQPHGDASRPIQTP